jgi:TolA-binding protein
LRRHALIFLSLISAFSQWACSVDSAKNHYLLAEKLWNDKNYSAAVSEFEKVTVKDPRGKLGSQALFRSATTQFLFLSQYNDSVTKFKAFVQMSRDSRLSWEAQLHIGEIFYSKTDQYDQAISHYRELLKERPYHPDAPEFLYRVAKSHFFLFQFGDAIVAFEELMKRYPNSPLVEKALYGIGSTYLTRGEQYSDDPGNGNQSYELAKETFEKFLKRYPKSTLVSEAQFGIASCLEELDQLQKAFEAFESLKKTYPSPDVIQVKLSRIRDRIHQRQASR